MIKLLLRYTIAKSVQIITRAERSQTTDRKTSIRLFRDRVLKPSLLVPAPHLIRRFPLLWCIIQPSIRHNDNTVILRRSDKQCRAALATESSEEGVATFEFLVFISGDNAGGVLRISYLLRAVERFNQVR